MDHFPTDIPIDEKLLTLWYNENNRVFKDSSKKQDDDKELEEAAMFAFETISQNKIENLERSFGDDTEGIVEPKSGEASNNTSLFVLFVSLAVIFFIVIVGFKSNSIQGGSNCQASLTRQ